MEGVPVQVVGQTDAIYDTGTTQIVGDPVGIQQLYAPLLAFGAMPAPQEGEGIYTSTWISSVADHPPHNVLISQLQFLATSMSPSLFMLEGRKSRFPLKHLTLAPYLPVLLPATAGQPMIRHSRAVS